MSRHPGPNRIRGKDWREDQDRRDDNTDKNGDDNRNNAYHGPGQRFVGHEPKGVLRLRKNSQNDRSGRGQSEDPRDHGGAWNQRQAEEDPNPYQTSTLNGPEDEDSSWRSRSGQLPSVRDGISDSRYAQPGLARAEPRHPPLNTSYGDGHQEWNTRRPQRQPEEYNPQLSRTGSAHAEPWRLAQDTLNRDNYPERNTRRAQGQLADYGRGPWQNSEGGHASRPDSCPDSHYSANPPMIPSRIPSTAPSTIPYGATSTSSSESHYSIESNRSTTSGDQAMQRNSRYQHTGSLPPETHPTPWSNMSQQSTQSRPRFDPSHPSSLPPDALYGSDPSGLRNPYSTQTDPRARRPANQDDEQPAQTAVKNPF